MYQASLPSFTIKLEKTKDAQKSDGTYPIILRVLYNRTQRRVRLGISCLEHQLIDGQLKSVYDVDAKNKIINDTLERALKIYESHFLNRSFDYKLWLRLFKEKKVQKHKNIGLLEFAIQVYDYKMSLGKVKSAYDYKAIHSLISRFTKGKEVYFDELNGEQGKSWLKELETYLLKRGLKGFSYMKNLKSLYTKAEEEYIIKEFKDTPFKGAWNPRGYSFSHLRNQSSKKINNNRIKSIPIEYLIKILEYQAPKGSNEEYYLALWKFGYFLAGVNFKDIALLKWVNIKNGRWHYKRSKTKVGLKNGKPIPELAMKIIEKYGNRKGTYVFDILNGGYDKDEETLVRRVDNFSGKIRRCTKKISKKLGLDGYFTPYSGRHTAINVALSSGIDTNTVRSAVDQKSMTAIDSYIAETQSDKLVELMNSLRVTEKIVV